MIDPRATRAAPIPMSARRFGVNGNSFHFPARYARFGEFTLDLQNREMFRGALCIKLQTKVFEALLVLLEAPGEVVSRECIRQKLWPGDSMVNFDANVNTTVNKLRQVLADSVDKPAYVQTIPRKGYSFVAQAAFSDAPPVTPETEQNAHPSSDAAASSRHRGFLRSNPAQWLVAGVIALVLSGALFGAAVMLYSHRAH